MALSDTLNSLIHSSNLSDQLKNLGFGTTSLSSQLSNVIPQEVLNKPDEQEVLNKPDEQEVLNKPDEDDPLEQNKKFFSGIVSTMGQEAFPNDQTNGAVNKAVNKAIQPIKTGLGYVYDVAETPFRVLKTGANAIANLGVEKPSSPTNVLQAIMNPDKSASFADILNSNPSYKARADPRATQILGAMGEMIYDPLNVIGGPLARGLGTVGEGAGKLAGKVLNAGEKIEGPVGDLSSKLKQFGLGTQEAFSPYTNNPEANNLIMQKRLNPQNYEILNQQNQLPETKNFLADHAGMGATPEETLQKQNALRQQILDYIEPKGSQAEGVKAGDIGQKLNQMEAGAKLSPEVKAYADELKAKFQGAQERELGTGTVNYPAVENYVPHQWTPEFTDFTNKTFNPEQRQKIMQSAETVNKDFQEPRHVPMTINEVNNLFAQGMGSKVPGMGGWKQLDNFKGKMFNDQIEDLAADRYLKSTKIANEHDFMQSIGKTYGKPEEAIKATENPKDWVKVSSPSFKDVEGASEDGTMWFPRNIGNYLNRTQEVQLGKYVKPFFDTSRAINNFTKAMNFGIWPASAMKIEVGNQMLAYLSDLWSPHSQFLGHSIAAKIRQGGIQSLDASKPVIYSPKLGALTERDIYYLASYNRGIGMGLFRSEFPSFQPVEKGTITKPWQTATSTGWRVHNYVEDGTRMGTFIEALKQGNEAFEAGQLTQKALYDYSAMGPVPQFIRQYLPIPFFTFAYKNLPAMVGKLVSNPMKSLLYEKVRDLTDKNDKMNDYWKEWQADNMPIPLGTDKNGQVYYLFAGHLLPEIDVNEILGSGRTLGEAINNTPGRWVRYAAGMVNPYIKTPIETYFNKSAYFDTPIQRMEGEKQATGLGFNLPAKLSYYLRNTIRPPSEIGRATNESVPLPLRLTRFLTGANIQQVDPELQKEQAQQQLLSELKGGGKTGGVADIRHYQFLYGFLSGKAKDAEKKGDMGSAKQFQQQADLAKENMDTAIANFQKTAERISK